MQVSLTATSGLERRLEVAVPAQRITSEVEQRLQRLSRTARLKGFRPGKAPLSVVRQQFGEQVHTEVLQDVLRKSYAEAVEQEKLKPAGSPRIEPISMESGGDLKYAATFEVMPQIELQPLDGTPIERPVAGIADADVEAMLENMRKQLAEREKHAAEHAAHCTDPSHDHGSHAHAAETSADGNAVPATGEAPPTDVTLPTDEEFCRAFGIQEGGIGKLREEVRKSMERELEEKTRATLRNQALEALYKANPIEVPKTLIEEEVQRVQMDIARRYGLTDYSQLPKSEALEASAQRRVALGLLLGELIRVQDLKVDAERVRKRIDEIAAGYPDPAQARQAYLQNAQALRQIESMVLEEQAVDWILQRAHLTDRPTTFKELTGFGQGPNQNSEEPT